MQQSCSDAGQLSPLSWLVGWEYNPPADLDMDELELQKEALGEPSPKIEDVKKANAAVDCFVELEGFEQHRKQGHDSRATIVAAAGSKTTEGLSRLEVRRDSKHIVQIPSMLALENSHCAQRSGAQPVIGDESGRLGIKPGGQAGDGSQGRLHGAILDVMNVSFGSPLKVGKVQNYLDAVLGKNAAVGITISGTQEVSVGPIETCMSQQGPRETVTVQSISNGVIGGNKIIAVSAVNQEFEPSVVKSEMEFDMDHAGVVSPKRKEPEVPELELSAEAAAKRIKSVAEEDGVERTTACADLGDVGHEGDQSNGHTQHSKEVSQQCTDLTGLLDALSDGSSSDFDQGDGISDLNWWQESDNKVSEGVITKSLSGMDPPVQSVPVDLCKAPSLEVKHEVLYPGENPIDSVAQAVGLQGPSEGIPSSSQDTSPPNLLSSERLTRSDRLQEGSKPGEIRKFVSEEERAGSKCCSPNCMITNSTEESTPSSCESPSKQLPTVGESLAMHTISVEEELTRRISDSGCEPRNSSFLQDSKPQFMEIVCLDSDSDEEGKAIEVRTDESTQFRKAVNLEHEGTYLAGGDSREIPKDGGRGKVRGNDDNGVDEGGDIPVFASITMTGKFQHAAPPTGHPVGVPNPGLPSSGDTVNRPSTKVFPSMPGQGVYQTGHPISNPLNVPRYGVHPSGQPPPSRVHNYTPLGDIRDMPHAVIAARKLRKLRRAKKRWMRLREGQSGPAEPLKARSRASNPVHPVASPASTSRHNMGSGSSGYAWVPPAPEFANMPQGYSPQPNHNGASSVRERLSQADQPRPVASMSPQNGNMGGQPYPLAVAPPSHSAAVQNSPLSVYSQNMRPMHEIMQNSGTLLQQNGLISVPPNQERKPVVNQAPWNRYLELSAAVKPEPVTVDSSKVDSLVKNQLQLVVSKLGYDSTVSTPRDTVIHALKSYKECLERAQANVGQMRRDMAQRTGETPDQLQQSTSRFRVDITAYNDMKKEKEDVNRAPVVGDVPGVEVGDQFTYRHEMAIVGVHHLPNVGIAYGYIPPENIITATAIVCVPKGGYTDNVDEGYKVVYTGQGGRSERTQNAPFVEHQKLEKGNKALVSNFDRNVPVRMIRAHANISQSSNRKLLGYTYDGLYRIVNWEFSMGLSGFNVYKFSLERLENQPRLPACVTGCTAHPWNDRTDAVAAEPLQFIEPDDDIDVKQILGAPDLSEQNELEYEL